MTELTSWKEREFNRIRQDIERAFRRSYRDFGLPMVPKTAGYLTAVDLSESETEFVVTAELPEIKSENIDIDISGNALTIRVKTETETVREGVSVQRFEHTSSSSSRRIVLPGPVAAEKATASFNADKLIIKLPKRLREEKRRVQIESR